MTFEFNSRKFIDAVVVAAHALDEQKEEINKLNVFPVPDGDTGTNMSLTVGSVENNLLALPASASLEDVCHAITTGALMGARGNSGVITSQILRGICEGLKEVVDLNSSAIANIFAKSEEVAYKAVRKPVKGTILTVLSDCATAAKKAADADMTIAQSLEFIVEESYSSVKRTPEFLPVLKENNVVDAGGFGLSIFLNAFVASYLGKSESLNLTFDVSVLSQPKVEIEQINDWEGSEYRYCNEFLVDSDTLNIDDALDFLYTMGDCELCVGATPKFKVHVHSNEPDKVLKYFLDLGQISEVHIHNMDLQSIDRAEKIASEQSFVKDLAIVAVCTGSGNEEILKSLGVDVVVSGGQTMNPSTKDLLDAAKTQPAKSYIFLPNNKNIIMAAESACNLLDVPAKVVPTTSVPQAFSALFELNLDSDAEENAQNMASVLGDVVTGEVTTAIKDSKDDNGNPIKEGDVIGILDGKIIAVGSSVAGVVKDMLASANTDDFDTITLLAGSDYSDDDLARLSEDIENVYADLEVDAQRGDQPLYPIVFSLE